MEGRRRETKSRCSCEHASATTEHAGPTGSLDEGSSSSQGCNASAAIPSEISADESEISTSAARSRANAAAQGDADAEPRTELGDWKEAARETEGARREAEPRAERADWGEVGSGGASSGG